MQYNYIITYMDSKEDVEIEGSEGYLASTEQAEVY